MNMKIIRYFKTSNQICMLCTCIASSCDRCVKKIQKITATVIEAKEVCKSKNKPIINY